MADQDTNNQDVESKALSMGWAPKEKFRGDPEKWADAQTFVDRGEHFLPILKANNRKLQEEFGRTAEELRELKGLLQSSQESVKELKKFHEDDTRRKVQDERTRLLAELRRAKNDADVDAEVDITDQLTKVNAALKEEKEVQKETSVAAQTPRLDPAFTEWQSRPENAWFGKDARRTRLAIAVAEDLRAGGDRTVGAAFYEKVADEVSETFGEASKPTSKVSSSRGGSGSGGTGNGKAYKDLPSEAKEACATQAKNLVGPGKAFETAAAWQAYYADVYFKE